MTWPAMATVLVVTAVLIALLVSAISQIASGSAYDDLRRGAFAGVKRDCRRLRASDWKRTVAAVDAEERRGMVPVSAFAFADYVDGRIIECEGEAAIDYGIALGYAPAPGGAPSYQLSCVLRSEDVSDAVPERDPRRTAALLAMDAFLLDYIASTGIDRGSIRLLRPFVSPEASAFVGLPENGAPGHLSVRMPGSPSTSAAGETGPDTEAEPDGNAKSGDGGNPGEAEEPEA